ncbi:hypothetical protein C2E23DRAFT_707017, partial [Lenzites betulinus]
FINSMYLVVSFNLGPNPICVKHTDALNNPANWIHIVALGNFNPTCGGHLILVIWFPPGSLTTWPSPAMR